VRLSALLAGTQLTSDACGAFVSLSRIFLCISACDMTLSFVALSDCVGAPNMASGGWCGHNLRLSYCAFV